MFTSGVLDYFMDHNINFPYTVGVSAGACNGLSYIAGQRGRAHICNIEMMDKYHYVGLKYLFTKHNIMDFDLLFDLFPNKLVPFDYETFFASDHRFAMVTTNCRTGKPEYFEEKSDPQRLLNICRASCSMPFVCPVVYVDNVPMLDGGISDAIPVRKSIAEGYVKNVVVLTRNKGYRKKEKEIHLPSFAYREYPFIRDLIRERAKQYNETVRYIEQLEQEGRILVIRPLKPMQVSRIEKDIQKLSDLYDEGYECAAEVFREVYETA